MAHIAVINGRIGRDAETKQVGDTTVVEFSLAETTKRGSTEHTSWFRVSVWGRYGDALKDSLRKGVKCSVAGELLAREYTDRDGNKRTSLDISANEVNVPYAERSEPQSQNGDFRDDDLPF